MHKIVQKASQHWLKTGTGRDMANQTAVCVPLWSTEAVFGPRADELPDSEWACLLRWPVTDRVLPRFLVHEWFSSVKPKSARLCLLEVQSDSVVLQAGATAEGRWSTVQSTLGSDQFGCFWLVTPGRPVQTPSCSHVLAGCRGSSPLPLSCTAYLSAAARSWYPQPPGTIMYMQ
jgi:hypothetical protein